jgi:hypothetical protein
VIVQLSILVRLVRKPKQFIITGSMQLTARNTLILFASAIVLLFAVGFLLRVWGLSYFHFWDEMVYLQNAKVICCGKTNYSELSYRPPLLSILFAGVFRLWDNVFAASIATAALNALGPVLLFFAGRRIVGRLPAMLAAVLLTCGPFFVGVFPSGFESDDTGNSLLTDSPALTLVILALLLMLRAIEKPRLHRFALAGFAVSLAILMRFGSIPSVGLLCLLPLLASVRWKALAAMCAGIMAGLAPYLIWSRVNYGGFFRTLGVGWRNVEGPEPSRLFFIANLPAIFTWAGVVGLAIAAVVGLAAAIRYMRENPRAAEFTFSATPNALLILLWLWLLIDFSFFSLMPHKEPRYIMPLAPPLLLLAGYGLAQITGFKGRYLRLAGFVLLAAGMVACVFPSYSRIDGPFVIHDEPEEMKAAAFLVARYPPETPFYCNFNYPAFAYFTNYTIGELPIGGPEVYEAIDEIPAGGILVAYRKNESGEPKIDLLNRNMKLKVIAEYTTLVIYQRQATPKDDE